MEYSQYFPSNVKYKKALREEYSHKMKSTLLTTSLLAAVAVAAPSEPCVASAPPQALNDPLLSSVQAVRPPLSTLISLVNSFSSSDGLMGALNIQESYYPLYTSVMSLSAAANNHAVIAPNNVVTYINALNSLVGDISTLLSKLDEKVNLFQEVGAGDIVVGDITSLGGPASAIESNLFSGIPSNAPCPQVASASAVASKFSAAFASAAATYSISSGLPVFPTAPAKCANYC